ncbi:MAG: PAS domain S-box protein [Planctomycetes bacterium]|nr:PAS domain S-box protein [Planctomycetota bacterium]
MNARALSETMGGRRSAPGAAGMARPWCLALLVLALGLLGTWLMVRQTSERVEMLTNERFARIHSRLEDEVRRRLTVYAYGLRGARGVFAASKSVERDEFRAYAAARNLSREFAGQTAIMFVERVRCEDLDGFLGAAREDGYPEFTLKAADGADELRIVKFAEPMSTNEAALGYDLGMEPGCRAAMDRAARMNEPQTSPIVRLVSDPHLRPAVRMFLPVYANGAAASTQAERERACVGWVCAPVILSESLKGTESVGDGLLDVELYAGEPGTGTLAFDTDSGGFDGVAGGGHAVRGGRSRVAFAAFSFGGQEWTLAMTALPAFEAATQRADVTWAALGGGLASGLVALLVLALTGTSVRARALAESMTDELRRTNRTARRLALVAQRTSNAVVITGPDRTIEWVNEGFTRVTGYTLEEVKGRSPGSFLQCEKTDPAAVARIREALRSGRGVRTEILNRSKDGREYWLDIDIQPLHDEAGNLDGFMAIESDITDIVTTRNRLASMLSAMAEGIVVQEPGGRIVEVNPAAERILGLTRDQLLGRVSTDPRGRAIREDGSEFPGDQHPVSIALRTGAAVRGVVMGVCTPGGERRWISVSAEPVRAPDGSVTSAVASFADITALRTETQRLDLTIRGAGLGTWDWNIETGAVAFNEEWARMLGFHLEEVEAHVRSWERLVHPEDMPRVTQVLERHLRGETPDYRCEHRLLRKDGSWCWVHDAGRVIERDSGGRPLRAAGIHLDITASKELEADLEWAVREAQAATRAKSEFLANMSHEIRTPMTAILGYTDLLFEGGDLSRAPHERLECISTIKRNGEHLLTIINDILDLAKIESGKMTVECVEANPMQLVSDVISLMQVRAAGKNVTLETVFETSIPRMIRTDPTRLKQVLLNLIGNALKFTELGSVRLTVGFERSGPHGSRMRFEVSDTGVGMSPEQLSRLFGAFEQADTSTTRRFGGSGLGLTISKRLAEMMGGTITVESELGKGSTFTATVSAGEIDATVMIESPRLEAVARTPSAGRSDAERPLAGVRIMLAEDGPDNQRLIAHHLRKAGALVRVFENGLKALCALTQDASESGELVPNPELDLLLTDMQMPEMDGYTLARTLRARGFRLPIVALTAHAMNGDDRKCLDAGCDAYATKPIDRDKLIEVCRRAVANQAITPA